MLSINRIADVNLFLNIIKPLSWELYLGCILLHYGLHTYATWLEYLFLIRIYL